MPNLLIEGKDGPLLVEIIESGADNRSATYRLTVKPGQEAREGVHELVIWPDRSSQEHVVLPVKVLSRAKS